MDVFLTFQSMVNLMPEDDGTTSPAQSTLIARLFWTGAAMLESDFESEFLMGVSLMAKIAATRLFQQPRSQQLLQQVFETLQWGDKYPGVHALCLRGLTAETCAGPTLELLSLFSTHLTHPVIGNAVGLALNVVSLLPRLLLGFNKLDRDEYCDQAASRLAAACQPQNSRLSKVFGLYASQTYPKDKDAWLADVAKFYGSAFFPQYELAVFGFIIQVLEQGLGVYQTSVADVLCALLKPLVGKPSAIARCHSDLIEVVVRLQSQGKWENARRLLLAGSYLLRMKEVSEEEDTESLESTVLDPLKGGTWRLREGFSIPLMMQDDSEPRARQRLSSILQSCGKQVLPALQPVIFGDDQQGGHMGSEGSRAPTPLVGDAVTLDDDMDGDSDLVAQLFNDFAFLDQADEPDSIPASPNNPRRSTPLSNTPSGTRLNPNAMPQVPEIVPEDTSGMSVAERRRLFVQERADEITDGDQLAPPPVDADARSTSSSQGTSLQLSHDNSMVQLTFVPRGTRYFSLDPASCEETWSSLVNRLVQTKSSDTAVDLFAATRQMIQSLLKGYEELTIKLGKVAKNGPQVICDHIAASTACVQSIETLPFVYVTSDIMESDEAMSQFCCQSLRLQQALEAFTTKRVELLKAHKRLKNSSFRRTSITGLPGTTATSLSVQRVALCDLFCKLQVRLAQVLDIYHAILADVANIKERSGIFDFSDAGTSVLSQVTNALQNPISSISLDRSSVTEAQAEQILLENMQAGNFTQAIALLRGFRAAVSDATFGRSSFEDEDVLMYLSLKASSKPKSFAIAGNVNSVASATEQLSNISFEMLGDLQVAQPDS
eukprot:TRINITY_DN10738_c0_g1_i1.p1 TRINITY_DN10738_c0_g1~~TRINITY_DN10738_c0_g1_i1.p1  ORF type:complete len:944 (+),score=180.47 TRINITY_DN10738_c0_g1_i1:341-2833(+)